MSAAGGGNFLQQIQAAKAEKAQTIEQLKVLDEKVAEQHHKVYSSLLGINAEIANKFFKESTSDISFSARISSAVALMENETKRLELGMDMSEVVDSDFDQRLDTLKELKAQWKKLQSDIHSPIKESSLFLQATAVLSRTNQEDFSSVDDIIKPDELAFLDSMNRVSDMAQSILQVQEVEMERKIAAIDEALRGNTQRIAAGLEDQAAARKAELREERLQHRADLDNMYSSLLQEFLDNAQCSSNTVSASYHALDRKRTHDSADNKAEMEKANRPPRPPTWKSEVDALFLAALREDQRDREVEAQLDAALIEDLSESQIEVLDHGMEDGSLTAVIDRLTELYLESSEIDAKLLKR